jgi:hypothetical protein
VARLARLFGPRPPGHEDLRVAGRGGDPRLVLSGGQTLHADYNPIADCGNFDNGQITLKSGAASAGCLTFQVPKGQKVVRVSYGNTVFHGNTQNGAHH